MQGSFQKKKKILLQQNLLSSLPGCLWSDLKWGNIKAFHKSLVLSHPDTLFELRALIWNNSSHPALLTLLSDRRSGIWKKNDISSNFLNHHNNSSERTRYNLGNTGGAWLLETRWVQHVLALEEQRHINQAVKEPKAVYVRVYFQKNWQIGFKAAKAPNSLHAISPTLTSALCYPRSSCGLTLTGLLLRLIQHSRELFLKRFQRGKRYLWRRTQKSMQVDYLLCENVAHFCLLLSLSLTYWANNKSESKEMSPVKEELCLIFPWVLQAFWCAVCLRECQFLKRRFMEVRVCVCMSAHVCACVGESWKSNLQD